MAKTKLWQQLNYGKLVSAPEASILPGQEHGHKGRSADFPAGLSALCVPGQIGLGTDDLFRWDQFPWNEQGGFVHQPVFVDNTPYVVAARIRGRPEAGEGQEGRRYIQANYAVLPAADWSPAQLQPLVGALRAEPLVSGQPSPSPLQVTGRDMELPSDWLERIRLPLTALMSGVPLSVQDKTQAIEAFVEILALCLAAVPAALAWRVPCGAGVGVMLGELALAHGQIAKGGLRMLGKQSPNELEFDLTRGEFYHDWLAEQCEDVTTLIELIGRVAERHPSFALALDAPARSWTELAREISGTMIEEKRLWAIERWMRDGLGERPAASALSFEYLGERPLELVLAYRQGAGMELLPEFAGHEWLPHWKTLTNADPTLRPLAILLGSLPLESRDDLRGIGAEVVPDALRPLADQTLDALVDSATPAQLARLVAEIAGPGLLKAWYERQRDVLAWRALAALRDGDAVLWDGLTRRNDGQIGALERLAAVLADQCQSLDELRALLAGHRDGAHDLRALLHARYPTTLARLLIDDLTTPTSATNAVAEVTRLLDTLGTWSGDGLVLKLDAMLPNPAELVCLPRTMTAALAHGAVLPIKWRRALAPLVGQPAAALLLDWDSEVAPGPQESLAIALCDWRVGRAPELVDHLWHWLAVTVPKFTDRPEGLELLGRWLADASIPLPADRVSIAFVAGMLRAGAAAPPRLLPDEAELVLIRAVLGTAPTLHIVELVEQIDSPEQWLSVLALLPRIQAPVLTLEQFIQLQRMRLEQPEWWRRYSDNFKRVGWDRHPVWRLLFDTHQKPKDNETHYLDALPGDLVLRLKLIGQPVTKSGLNKLDAGIIAAHSEDLDIEATYDLMRAAHDADCVGVVLHLIAHSWARLSGEERNNLTASVMPRAAAPGVLGKLARKLGAVAPRAWAVAPRAWMGLVEFGCHLLPEEFRDCRCRKITLKQIKK